jgi:outer membrane protein
MKKNVLLLSVLLALMFTANVYAESSKFGIGARVGYNIYRNGSLDANLSGYGSLGNVDYSNQSVGFIGLNGTYQYNENFSLELSIDRMIKSQSDFKASGLSYKAGDITQTPVLLTARYHFPVGMFSPYVGAGFGYYFNDYAKDNAFWNANANVSLKNNWGYHVNVGSEYFITQSRNIALNIDLKYVWNKADMEASNGATQITGSMNLDAYLIGLGIKYYF